MLLDTVDATEKKAHSHDQKQVRQHTANERGLYDNDLLLDQCQNSNNQLDGVTKTARLDGIAGDARQ